MFIIFRHLRFFYKKLRIRRLRYTLPFFILVLYTVAGAYVFRYFELDEDERKRAYYRENTEYAFKRTLNRMLEVRCQEGLDEADRTLQTRHVKEHLFWLMDYLNLTQVIEERSEGSPWTWMGSMFYAGQLYTTIGYGMPATQTPSGRLASIVYIMIGIPLFLIILAEVGKLLSRGLRKLYKRLHKMRKLPEAAGRRMSEPMKAIYQLTTAIASTAMGAHAAPLMNGTGPAAGKGAEHKQNQATTASQQMDVEKGLLLLADGNVGSRKDDNNNPPATCQQQLIKEKNPPTALKTKSFPIAWALAILIVWICFSAALFCIWETEWGYMTSIYFFFVSISTVGLGDLVPTKPDMMIVNFFMILIGLALLSMCVNLIQEALEKLIERLIEQYIDEIEKIAAVVQNPEVAEYADEIASPFEVGLTAEMLTVPAAALADDHQKLNSVGQAVKDWFAERASNVLLNRIYPPEESSESSFSDEDEEEEEDEDYSDNEGMELEDLLEEGEEEEAHELEAVVVESRQQPMLALGAKMADHTLPNRSDALLLPPESVVTLAAEHELLVPQISIHESTPPSAAAASSSVEGAAVVAENKRGKAETRDGLRPTSPTKLQRANSLRLQGAGGGRRRKTSLNSAQTTMTNPNKPARGGKRKREKVPKVPKYYAGALLKYSTQTMQAIQAIEYAKLRTGKSSDFKSRLFAKFATNQRFSRIVETNAQPPKQMVSSSVQTTPLQSPQMKQRRNWRMRRMDCGVESMDSTSSDVNATTTSRTGASCSYANDLDSLYSNTYFDLCFGGYSTDSVPKLMAQGTNTPTIIGALASRGETGGRKESLSSRRKLSEKLMGFFERIMPGAGGGGGGGGGMGEKQQRRMEDDRIVLLADQGSSERLEQRRCHSSPSTPQQARRRLLAARCLNDSNQPSIPTTPLIQLTDPSAEQLRLSLTPSSSLAAGIAAAGPSTPAQVSPQSYTGTPPRSNRKQIGSSALAFASSSRPSVPPPLIGFVPFSSSRRRHSAINCLSVPGSRSSSMSALNELGIKRTRVRTIGSRPEIQSLEHEKPPLPPTHSTDAQPAAPLPPDICPLAKKPPSFRLT